MSKSDEPASTLATPVQQPLPLAFVNGEAVIEKPEDLYIPPEALEVILESFEGPLDLLLYLIRKQKFDITTMPVAEITRQYMEYVEVMQTLKLELAAEYLLMAAILAEIKRRAEGFDPLQLDLNDELLAMSGNGWWSLGRKGLVLEFQQGKGRFREYAILKTPQTGRKRWVVRLDDRDKAHFSRLEDAVEAVDYEVEQLGRRATETASEWAEWRQEPAPEALAARLARRGITQGEARRLLAFEKHVGRGPGRRAR